MVWSVNNLRCGIAVRPFKRALLCVKTGPFTGCKSNSRTGEPLRALKSIGCDFR